MKSCWDAIFSIAVVTAGNVRFTVLTVRLLRLEYSPTGVFEDRPSQAFCYRRQPVPAFNVRRGDGSIEIETEHLLLRCTEHPRGFTPVALCAHAWAAAGAASCVRRVGAVEKRTYGKPGMLRCSGGS
jgi:hypothetical protein